MVITTSYEILRIRIKCFHIYMAIATSYEISRIRMKCLHIYGRCNFVRIRRNSYQVFPHLYVCITTSYEFSRISYQVLPYIWSLQLHTKSQEFVPSASVYIWSFKLRTNSKELVPSVFTHIYGRCNFVRNLTNSY